MRNIKKFPALLLAVLMLISLAGCGSSGDDPAPSGPSNPNKDLTVHENTFFNIGYNEKDGWTAEKDDIELYDGGGSISLRIFDKSGDTIVQVFVEACEEDGPDFRETLVANGIDLKAYADGTCASETIGGVKLAAVDKGYDEWSFYGRNEDAGVSYTIVVTDRANESVPALLENITFTASGTDNVDPPWPWDGEPFSGSTLSQTVGSYTLTAQFLPMDDPMVTYETFNHDIAVVGDRVFLLSDYALYLYDYDGDSLSFVKEIPLDSEYEILEKGDGNIILSSFMEPIVGHNGNGVDFSYEGPDKFSVAPGATWGISWFYDGNECELYSFHNGALNGSPFPFNEVDSVRQINIDNQYILVSGSAVSDGEQYIFVYDYSGELIMQLGGEPGGFGLGSISFATSTPNGFLALDGNMREVVLWSTDGTWLGAVSDGDLFGTGYPWIAAADVDEDGSILVVMSDTREDESADEVLVFKLSGF